MIIVGSQVIGGEGGGGGSGLPTSSGAGQVPVSDAGGTYAATGLLTAWADRVTSQAAEGDVRALIGAVATPRYGALADRGAAADYPGGTYWTAGSASTIDDGVLWYSQREGASSYSWVPVRWTTRPTLPSLALSCVLTETSGTTVAETVTSTTLAVESGASLVPVTTDMLDRRTAIMFGDSSLYAQRQCLRGAATINPTPSLTALVWWRPGHPRKMAYYTDTGGEIFTKAFAPTSWNSPWKSWGLRVTSAEGTIVAGCYVGSTSYSTPTTDPRCRAQYDRWNLLALVRGADGVLRCIVNGVEAGSISAGSAGSGINYGTNGPHILGGIPSVLGSGAPENAVGQYAGAYVLSTALTAAQCLELYERQTGLKRS